MTSTSLDTGATPPNEKRLTRQFLVANVCYLALVYVWALGIPALGRDFEAFAGITKMELLSEWVFRGETALFGGFAAGYLAVNLLLLYGCMVCTFFLTRYAVGGPVWLGSLAMALLMAHPLKSEAVLNLSGVSDMLPAFTALLAIALYARSVKGGRVFSYGLALAAFAFAAFGFRSNAGLFVALLLYEIFVPSPEERRIWRMGPVVVVGVMAAVLRMQSIASHEVSITGVFGPLQFIFWPIGVLPETSLDYMTTPWKLWIASIGVVACFAGMIHVTRHRAFTFGILGVVALRMLNAAEVVYPYQLLGGGQIITCIALFCVAFAALCQRIGSHPKWARPVVFVTTMLCIAFFGMQISAIFAWRDASNLVRTFQKAALEESQQGAEILVAPDYRMADGAPLYLSESISYDTPFSTAIPHRAAVYLNFVDKAEVVVSVPAPDRLELVVTGVDPVRVLPWSYTPERAAGDDHIVESYVGTNELHLVLAPEAGVYPAHIVSLAPRP